MNKGNLHVSKVLTKEQIDILTKELIRRGIYKDIIETYYKTFNTFSKYFYDMTGRSFIDYLPE